MLNEKRFSEELKPEIDWDLFDKFVDELYDELSNDTVIDAENVLRRYGEEIEKLPPDAEVVENLELTGNTHNLMYNDWFMEVEFYVDSEGQLYAELVIYEEMDDEMDEDEEQIPETEKEVVSIWKLTKFMK